MRPPGRLNLRINDLAAKSQWLERLSMVLADAAVTSPGTWDIRLMRYEIAIARIGYEVSRREPSGERVWEFPSVCAKLMVAPVISFVDGRDTAARRWEGEHIVCLQLAADRSGLSIVSNYGETQLTLGADAWLEVCDTAPPSNDRITTDYGDPAVDLQLASEILRARVL